jgi:hypothetical protein
MRGRRENIHGMMTHKKCKGSVYVDRVFSGPLRLDLFCLRCGKRWFIQRNKGAFGPWLSRIEYEKELA